MTSNATRLRQNRINAFAFVISVCLCVLFSIVIWALSFSNLGRIIYIELDDKINPNYAYTESLMRLPGVGLQRAEAIIEYRENLLKRGGIGPAFTDTADLQRVKGIGPKTTKNISEWLRFD